MPTFKAYDLPCTVAVAEGLTPDEAQRFEALGFYIEPEHNTANMDNSIRTEQLRHKKEQLIRAARQQAAARMNRTKQARKLAQWMPPTNKSSTSPHSTSYTDAGTSGTGRAH